MIELREEIKPQLVAGKFDQNLGKPREWQGCIRFREKGTDTKAAVKVDVAVMAAPLTAVTMCNTALGGEDIGNLTYQQKLVLWRKPGS